MSGTQRSSQAAGRDAHGPRRAIEGNPRRGRGGRRDRRADVPLRLLAGSTRPMSGQEQRELVQALAELLVEWVEAHPQPAPKGLKTSGGSDLDGCSRPKEQQP